jgi:hypothetical protein
MLLVEQIVPEEVQHRVVQQIMHQLATTAMAEGNDVEMSVWYRAGERHGRWVRCF